MSPPFDLTRYQDPLTIQRVLLDAKTVAIVGLSTNELRASHFVGFYLKRHGYRVIPGEPAREGDSWREELSRACATSRSRRYRERVPRARRAAGDRRRGRGDRRGTLWCQFGVINEEGARIAEAGGVSVVMDRCIKVEHARYVGRMHWLGFNTQRITSVRGGLQ